MRMHIIVSSFGVLWNRFTFSLGDMEKNQGAVYNQVVWFTIYRLKVEKFLMCHTQLRSMFQGSDKVSGKGDEIKTLYINCEKRKT